MSQVFTAWYFQVSFQTQRISNAGLHQKFFRNLEKNGSYGSNINLEEVIAKTATAVVSEVMKNIIPAFESNTIREYTEIPSIRRKRTPGIIDKLDPAIIKEVEEMLMSNRFSYLDIVHYLQDMGVEISVGLVHRYAKRMRSL